MAARFQHCDVDNMSCLWNMQIAQLSRQLAEVSQQHDAVSRLYEAESAVAAQCAEMVQRSHESISRLEERVSEACSLQAAAEQSRDTMEQQLHQAQVVLFLIFPHMCIKQSIPCM